MELTAENLHFAYRGSRETAAGIHLSLKPGNLTLLLGPNGCGKTTLLRLLTGELLPQTGVVRLDGRAIREWPGRERARAVGVVMQSAPPALDFTVREVVTLGRSPHFSALAGPSAADRKAVSAALELFDLTALAGRPCHALSGGERQRVMLAAAWADDPAILLLDEPVSAMDPAHALKVMRLLKERSRQTAVFMISHDLQTAAGWGDHLLLMQEGRIAVSGRRTEVLTGTNLRQLYGINFTLFYSADGRLAVLPSEK